MLAKLIVIAGLGLVVYVYAGYPTLLWLLAKLREKRIHRAAITPAVSMIIAVHNEESVLSQKLENALALDYPREQLEILVVSDGSTDDSENIASRYASQGVSLLRLDRCGKLRALEAAAARARGEILAFTDANTWVAPRALRALVANFADPDVGGVCGQKRVGRPSQAEAVAVGEGSYWKYEQLVKKLESRTGSTIAADGALYAIRRELFHCCSNPAQADDFAISARIPMVGKRLVFETDADVWEEPPSSAREEFRRKTRVTNHLIRSVWEARRALNPFRTGLFAMKLWSHKLLRYFVPFPLALAWIASLSLAGDSILYALLLGTQCAFYALAVTGAALQHQGVGSSPLLHTPFYFCLAHLAALIGVFSVLRGRRIVAWTHARADWNPRSLGRLDTR